MIARIGSCKGGESREQLLSNRLNDRSHRPDFCAETEFNVRSIPDRLWGIAIVKDGQPLKVVSISSEYDEALGEGRAEWDGSATVQFLVSLTPQTLSSISEAAVVAAQQQFAKDQAQAEADAVKSPAEVGAELEDLCDQIKGVGLKKNRRGQVEAVVVYECKRPVRQLSIEVGRKLMRLAIAFRKERCLRSEREKKREDAERERYKALKQADRGCGGLTTGESRQQFWPIDLLRDWQDQYGV